MTDFFDAALMQFIQEASEESCDYIVHELQGILRTDANVVKDYLRHPNTTRDCGEKNRSSLWT